MPELKPHLLSAPTVSNVERLMFFHSECWYHHCEVQRQEECPHYLGITYPGE